MKDIIVVGGRDYENISGEVVFEYGELIKMIEINIKDDLVCKVKFKLKLKYCVYFIIFFLKYFYIIYVCIIFFEFQEFEKDENFEVDLVEVDGGVKFGKLKCCVVIIVNDDGKDFWNIYYLLLKLDFY